MSQQAPANWLQQFMNAKGATVQATASAPPPVGGTSGSYTPSQSGGVTGGGRSLIQLVAGQNTTQVDPALQASLPDAGDQASVQAANSEFQQQHDAWKQQYDALVPYATVSQDARNQLSQLLANEPKKPDLLAIQNQSDRNRLLNEANGAYSPLIQSLLKSALGQGPSAALSTYKAAADDASRRAYGMAASSNGTGGQRSALFQAALGQAAQTQQQAANQAATIKAQEQARATAGVNSALQGLTNVYGTQNLYGGTIDQQKVNQDAENNAINLNEQIAQNNANNSTATAKSVLSTAANATSGF